MFKLYPHCLVLVGFRNRFKRVFKINTKINWGLVGRIFVSVRHLSVLPGHSFFFIPATTANDLRLRRIFLSQILSITFFNYLISWERASMFSAKQGNYWYHFYNVFGMTRSLTGLNPGPPILDASTLPLGYQGGIERLMLMLMLMLKKLPS